MDLQTILLAWEHHFFAKKYNDVKLDNIANELNIKKPSLYYYFKNKREYYLEVLRYSKKKYLQALKDNVETGDLASFLMRYLEYPSKEKNLFAIAAQKWYGDDKEINAIIQRGKQLISTEMTNFLSIFHLSPVKMYLICQLLDKLATENCIDGYCLMYSLDDITKELRMMISDCDHE